MILAKENLGKINQESIVSGWVDDTISSWNGPLHCGHRVWICSKNSNFLKVGREKQKNDKHRNKKMQTNKTSCPSLFSIENKHTGVYNVHLIFLSLWGTPETAFLQDAAAYLQLTNIIVILWQTPFPTRSFENHKLFLIHINLCTGKGGQDGAGRGGLPPAHRGEGPVHRAADQHAPRVRAPGQNQSGLQHCCFLIKILQKWMIMFIIVSYLLGWPHKKLTMSLIDLFPSANDVSTEPQCRQGPQCPPRYHWQLLFASDDHFDHLLWARRI